MAELQKLNNAKIEDAEETEENLKPARIGIRHLQCFLLFGGLSVGYAMRVNLSVAIVAMTDKNSTNPNFEEFDWNEKTKSLMLSSFFWGYCITQVPCGQLARKYGAKVLLLYGNLISAVLAVLTPFLVSIGNWQLLFVVRVIQGLCQGCLFPCTHTMLSTWAPVHERGPLCTYCYAGTLFGSVIMLATSGILASSPYGWPSIFYFSGILGFAWVAALYVWGANTPDEYKNMPRAEKLYIERSLQAQQKEHKAESISEQPALRTPWLKIFTSAPFLVLALAHAVHNYCFWTLLTQIPSYMKHILHMDIKSNALLSSLPYTTMLVLSFAFCSVSDFLNARKCLSISASRKLFNTIGQWIPMTTLIGLAYVSQDQVQLAIILLTITVGLNSASFLGFQVNHIDLSPNFAGVLMGITNCGANIMSVIAPLVVGFIVTDEKNSAQWRIVFFIAGGFYFLGNLLFLTFGQTKIQPWNDPKPAATEFTLIRNHSQEIKTEKDPL